MPWNSNLHKAKDAKKDEFYTQLSDIENELRHYKEHFKGKIILCNCDDPRVSNFFHYFAYNFEQLGLKRLITTCYKNQNPDLFTLNESEKAVYLIYDWDRNWNKIPDIDEIWIHELKWDWDFRSQECIELLKQADIVVTNPPFSLFREYFAQLIKYDKKFLILSNMNAITYKEVFPLIKENRIWIWYWFNMSMIYKTPYPNIKESNRKFVIRKWFNPDEWYLTVPAICWFTNLDIKKRHEDLIMYKKYNTDNYPKYDNYDAINIDKVSDIPCDYSWTMWVPITFLDKYNPEQFEIVGMAHGDAWVELGLKPYPRELKKLNKWMRDGDLYYMVNGMPILPYRRILIRRKK